MKIAIVSLVLALALLTSVACSRRNGRTSKSSSFVVTLPAGWLEVPGKSPREYRRQTEGAGVLQISLQPPTEHPIKTGEAAEKELAAIIESLTMDLGQRQLLAHDKVTAGVIATALYKSDQHGLLQFWLIPAKVTVFASFTMGTLDTAAQEMAEAAQIMGTLRLE